MSGHHTEGEQRPAHERRGRTWSGKYTWRHQLCRLPWLMLIVLGLLLPRLAGSDPAGVERVYSRSVYPVIARILAAVSSIVPFSLAEALIVAVPAVLAAVLIIRLLRLIFGKWSGRHKNRIRFFSFLISLGIFGGVMLNLFYCLWGFNHYRLPLSELMNLHVREYSVEEVAAVYGDLAKRAAELRNRVDEDARGVFTIGDYDEAFESVVRAYERLGESSELIFDDVYAAKPVKLSEYMSRAGIAGIYIPYTAEMNVNVDQPALYIPSGAAHETAHYFGFAREDEANFFAYYVSLFTDDAALEYSAVMHALAGCGNRLLEMDDELYFELRGSAFTDGMNRDVNDYRMYFLLYENDPVQDVFDGINDAYLQYNGQRYGVGSYGRMVELILAYYDSTGFFDTAEP